MTIKIEIVSADTRVIKGISQKGKDYEMEKQEGYLHNGHAYPALFEFSLGKNDDGSRRPAYKPGFYTLASSSLRVNREFGRLEVDPFDLVLLPLVDEPAKAGK